MQSDFNFNALVVGDFSATQNGSTIHLSCVIDENVSDVALYPSSKYKPKIARLATALNYSDWNKDMQCFIPVFINEQGILVKTSGAPYRYTSVNINYEI